MAQYSSLFVPSEPAKKKGLLWGSKDNAFAVDGEKLAGDIAAACNRMADAGLEVVSILPVTMGSMQGPGMAVGSGVAWSVTQGAVIVAKNVD